MEPVRLRLFGMSLTRRGYLLLQGLLLAVLALCVSVLVRLAGPGVPAHPTGPGRFLTLLAGNLYWIVPAVLILDGVEVALVLRRFAREEAGRRSPPPGAGGPSPRT